MARQPPGFTTLLPYLFVVDAPGYLRFLEGALGGMPVGRSIDAQGRIANAQVRFGDTTIMLSEAAPGYPPSRVSLYLYVDDADAAVARAVAHGGRLEMAVDDMPYGDRQGGVVDPAGNIWWISQRLVDGPYFEATDGATRA